MGLFKEAQIFITKQRIKELDNALRYWPDSDRAVLRRTQLHELELLKRFGITEEQYDILYSEQRGCCAVCRRPAGSFKFRLAVDHDHQTKEIRGLLCTHCNRWIVGRHRKGLGAELLRSAYEYLARSYSGWLVPIKAKKKKRRVRKIRKA